jgi:uncharacterized protein YggT (Ycf19 family)
MRPSRVRRRRTNLAIAHLIWALAIDIGAVLVALLLIRAVAGIIGASDRIAFVQLVRTLTEPIVWPLAHLPGAASA